MNNRQTSVFFLFFYLLGSCESFLVTLNYPPAIQIQPDLDVYYKDGESLTLPCMATGFPAPTFKWKRNGLELDYSDGRFVMVPGEGSLIISYTEERDEGVFQCLAENEFGTSASINVNLRMGRLNDFAAASPIAFSPHLGESLTLNCVPPLSVPRAEVEWILTSSDGSVEPVTYDNRVTKDYEGRLHITNVQQEDYQNGKAYRCMVTNFFLRKNTYGKAIHIIPTGNLPLLRPAQYLWTSPSDVLGLRGETLQLKCIFSGNPTPEVIWSKNYDVLPHDYNVSLGGQELTMTNVTERDAGSYQCYGSNTNGSLAYRDIVVRVESKPYWDIEPQDKNTNTGATVTFMCKAKGYPEPVIQWFVNGVKLEESQKPILHSHRFLNPDANNVTFVNVNNHDKMVLQCNASNIHGYVFADFYLNILAD
ncbi:neuroglian-like [Saccostrea cucullata]|uniref:neuroglian-like n=1 Tax=Saccostrea cuccullata TaxID=36930 RepID=UPI002ED40AB4